MADESSHVMSSIESDIVLPTMLPIAPPPMPDSVHLVGDGTCPSPTQPPQCMTNTATS